MMELKDWVFEQLDNAVENGYPPQVQSDLDNLNDLTRLTDTDPDDENEILEYIQQWLEENPS